MPKLRGLAAGFVLTLALGACSGGGGNGDPIGSAPPPTAPPAGSGDSGCTGSCATADSRLSTGEIQQIIAQAVSEAQANGVNATIAVVDRVGNVLAVFRMRGALDLVTITSERGVTGGLENLTVPGELAAIAKAITGAYLSSEGNAFTTRTANQIVQEHFNPGEFNAPAGPLFGVQFSQLPCSDMSQRLVDGSIGPKRSPLGLSADPGGLPLFKDGTPVGGIGVAADPIYGLDLVISNTDRDVDELIATAGTFGFAPPVDRRGDRITVDGKVFRFSDVSFADLSSSPGSGNFADIDGSFGRLIPVPAYFDGQIVPGTAFGTAASGFRADTQFFGAEDAFILVDQNNANRYPPRAGTDGANALTATEAETILREALKIANRARAQIRRPLSTQARVSISVVDTNGEVLAFARTRDAPVFGTEVSLQKARTAAFYSGSFAAADLQSLPPAVFLNAGIDPSRGVVFSVVGESPLAAYVDRVRSFLGLSGALADGAVAFSDRAGGNMSRPYYPDGIIGTQNGPFARPFPQWSPFSDGIQLDLVYNQLAQHVAHYLNQAAVASQLDGNSNTVREGVALFVGDTLLAPKPTPENP
ncbi:MAG: heme-binding protein, partial [Xanthomonadales bacterium]|nr:heme-binding protein [Xanthomonadales bacterium]